MRNSTLLYGRDLLWIASEMLEILTIIFNDNPCAVLNDGEDQKASMVWLMVWVVSGVPTMEMMSKRRSPS